MSNSQKNSKSPLLVIVTLLSIIQITQQGRACATILGCISSKTVACSLITIGYNNTYYWKAQGKNCCCNDAGLILAVAGDAIAGNNIV